MTKTCPLCNGTGQLCYFKGESRFLLSYQECPECCGTGYTQPTETPRDTPEPTSSGDAAASGEPTS